MVRLANDGGFSFANYIQGFQLISRSPLLSGQPSFASLALKLRSTTELTACCEVVLFSRLLPSFRGISDREG